MVIGVDEAGRGPLAGRHTYAASQNPSAAVGRKTSYIKASKRYRSTLGLWARGHRLRSSSGHGEV